MKFVQVQKKADWFWDWRYGVEHEINLSYISVVSINFFSNKKSINLTKLLDILHKSSNLFSMSLFVATFCSTDFSNTSLSLTISFPVFRNHLCICLDLRYLCLARVLILCDCRELLLWIHYHNIIILTPHLFLLSFLTFTVFLFHLRRLTCMLYQFIGHKKIYQSVVLCLKPILLTMKAPSVSDQFQRFILSF